MDIARSIQLTSEIWGAFTCLAMACFVAHYRHVDYKKVSCLLHIFLNNFILCISDALAWGFRGQEGIVGFVMVRVSNFFVFFSSIIMGTIVVKYVDCLMSEKDRRHGSAWLWPVFIITGVNVTLLVVSQFFPFLYDFDKHNRYYREEYYWIMMALGLVIVIYLAIYIALNRSKLDRIDFISFEIYAAVPFVALIIQLLFYGVSLTAFGYTISQILLFISYGMKYTNRLVALEKKHSEDRIAMLKAQISPHFIFNSLMSLQELCLEDPGRASYGIRQFSKYLRGNLEAMSNASLIPFTQELSHISEYIALENLDPSRHIRIQYDLGKTDFMVPVLSIEPLIENAVIHGTAYMEEGKIILRTFEDSEGIVIVVEDNGVGEDPGEGTREKHTGIALENVKERIKLQCGGSVEVEQLDPGFKVSVIIPSEKDTE